MKTVQKIFNTKYQNINRKANEAKMKYEENEQNIERTK